MSALADVTNTTTPIAENARLSLTTELSEHLLTNGYVRIDGVEEYVLSACERNDLKLLKLVREHSKLPWDMRVAGAKCAEDHGHTECVEYLRLDDSLCVKKAKKSPGSPRQMNGALKSIASSGNVDRLMEAMTDGTATASYKRAYEAAVGGEGLIMAYGGDTEFGEDDCLKDAPLNPRSLESVELWLAETQKVSKRKVPKQYDAWGQGALMAVLGHFKKVLA